MPEFYGCTITVILLLMNLVVLYIHTDAAGLTMERCLVANNSAVAYAGGVGIGGNQEISTITNCTVTGDNGVLEQWRFLMLMFITQYSGMRMLRGKLVDMNILLYITLLYNSK